MTRIKRILLHFAIPVLMVILGMSPGDGIDFSHKGITKALKSVWKENYKSIVLVPSSDSMMFNHISGNFFDCSLENQIVGKIYIGRINSCRSGGCEIDYSIDESQNEPFEYFDYLILFNPNNKVELVKIFNYQATHGYEVTSKHWLSQFKNYDGSEEIRYEKDIDAISGATVSAISLIVDVERITMALREMSLKE